MIRDHLVAWFHDQKKGKVFYTVLGHSPLTFKDENFQQLITDAIRWIRNFWVFLSISISTNFMLI